MLNEINEIRNYEINFEFILREILKKFSTKCFKMLR